MLKNKYIYNTYEIGLKILLGLIFLLVFVSSSYSQVNVAATALTTSGDPFPEDGMCPQKGRTLQVKVLNNGTDILNVVTTPVTITINITGPVNQSFSTVFNSGSPINPGGSRYVNVSTLGDFSLKGDYSVAMSATCTGDASPGTDVTETFKVEGNKLTLTSAPTTTAQTVCLKSPITTISYALSSNATNVIVAGLPDGVTSSFTYPTLTITGSPSTLAGSPFSYSVTSTGLCPATENETLNGSMIVKALPVISIVDKSNDTLTCNESLFIYNAFGGTTYSWSTGASTSNITVSTPGKYILTGTANGCSNKDSIDVKQNITPPNPPVGTDVSRCGPGTVNLSVTSVANTTVTWYASNQSTIVGPGLNYTTPSINTTTSYYVEAKNNSTGCLSTKSEVKAIIIPFNTAGTPSSTPTLCVNTALTPITHSTTGATGIGTATGLPSGVTASFNPTTGIITISGTPSSEIGSPFNYSIPLTGGCGTVNATGTITVNPSNTVTGPGNATLCINSALTPVNHTTTGATGIEATSTNYGLPSGLSASFNAGTGVITISGTPTIADVSPFSYSIPLTGGCGTVNAIGTIRVNPTNTVTGPASATTCINIAITPVTHNTTGATGIASTTTNYGLPSGLIASFNVGTGTITISGTPTTTVGSPFSYTIPLTGGCGTINATGTITVNPTNTVTGPLTASSCINVLTTPLNHTTTGATGIASTTTNYGLPTGLSASFNAGTGTITIAGTPSTTTGSPFSYSIPLTGGCGTINATGTITINPNNTVTGPATATSCINTSITPFTHTTTGATGIASTTTNYGLPSGLSASFNPTLGLITISGTPSSSTGSPFNYSIPLTGGCGTVNATGTISVNPSNTVTGPEVATLCINTALTPITHTTTGATGIASTTTNYGLPTGLIASFNATTGKITISGTPTISVGSPFSYNIPLTGGCGTFSATGTITVNPSNTVTGPLNASLCIDVPMTPINHTITGATGIASTTSNYGLPAGLSASFNAGLGKIIISGTPTTTVGSPFSYSIPLTGGCGTVNATGTITVNPKPTISPITGKSNYCVGETATLSSSTVGGEWSSSSSAIASIDKDNGLLNAVKSGIADIYYTVVINGCSNSVTYTVNVFDFPNVANVTGKDSLCVGDKLTLNNATNGGVWSSDNSVIASVVNGLVEGKSVGKVKINYTVTTNGCSTTKSLDINVNSYPTVPAISGVSDVCVASSIQLTNTTPFGTWSSSNPTVASINAFGLVTGKTPGSTVINYTVKNLNCSTTASANITVKEAIGVSAIIGNTDICIGATSQLTNATTGGTWSSSNTSVATVNSSTGLVTSVSIGTTTIKYDVITNGVCPQSTVVTFTVNQIPTVNAISDISVCEESLINTINFTGTGSPVVFQWTNNNPKIGLGAIGTGNIVAFNATGTTIGGGTEIAIINVTPVANGCAGSPKQFSITVNPLDNAGFRYSSTSFCKLDANPSPIISGLAGGSFSASNSNLSINTSSGLVDLSLSTPGYYQITYTTKGSCPNDSTLNFAVSSTPTVSAVSDQIKCDGSNFDPINFSGALGTIFNWENNNPSIGLEASNSGNIAPFKASGTTIGGTSVVGRIIVTPVSGSCIGTKDTFLLTVLPKDDATFTYPSNSFCSTSDPNPIANITGKSGGVFTMSPSGAIFNANTGAVSLSASNAGSYTLTYSTNGTCPNSQTISIDIGSNPSVNPISNQTICSGSAFNTINFSGTPGTTYNWSSSNPALIGLAPSGTGNILSFIGTGASSITPNVSSTITVTPTVGTCTGAKATFILTVKYKDEVAIAYSEPSYCSLNSNPTPTITGVSGGVFSSTPVGLIINSSTGLVDINASSQGLYQVTYQTSGSCGATATTSVGINNNPTVNSIPDQTVCSGINFTEIKFTGTLGTVFNWTNSNTNIGLAANGTGDIPSFNGVNNSGSTISSTITVTPKSGACTSASQTFKLEVNPSEDASFTYETNPICQNATNILPTISGTKGGLFSSSSGLSINSSTGEINLSTSTPSSYNVVYETNGTCYGIKSFPITINPIPVVNDVSSPLIKCQGSAFDPISFTGTVGAAYTWVNSKTSIGLASSGTGNIPSFVAKGTTIGGSPTSAVISVTPNINGCKGSTKSFVLTTNSLDNAGFEYSNNSYCFTESNPTPKITGNVGGVFSVSPSGLSIDASSGTLDLSTATAGNYQIKYTTNGLCKNDSIISISVGEAPKVDPVSDQVVCHGSNFNSIIFQGTSGTTYGWINTLPTIGLAASGTGDINTFLAQGTTIGGSDISSEVTVTPKIGTCLGASIKFKLTVKPLDDASFKYSSTSFCQNETNPSPTVTGLTGGTFTSTPVGLSMNSLGTINLSTSTSGSYTVSYTVQNRCRNVTTFPISIGSNPTFETVNSLTDQTVCLGSDFSEIVFKGSPGTEFEWENDNPVIGLALSGKGNIPLFKSLGLGVSKVVVTPKTGTCPGVSKTLTLTVKDITTSSISYDKSSYCTTEADPILTRTGPIGGVYTSSPAGLSINSSTGAISLNTSLAGDYNVSYNLTSQCSTSSSTSISIGSAPEVNPVSDYTVCNGATFGKIDFKGAPGTQFSWVNSDLKIGLPIAGDGDIPSFIGVNNTSTVISSNITVTPKIGNSCIGISRTFKLTINPSDNSNFNYSKLSFCKSDSDPIPSLVSNSGQFSSSPSGLTLNNVSGEITLSSSNPGTYNVTYLTKGLCPQASTQSVTINATPFVNNLTDISKCQGLDFSSIQLSGSNPPTIFEWNNDKPEIGLVASGIGIIPSFTASGTQKSGPSLTGTITVIPKINGCVGTSKTFQLTVNSLDDASFNYEKYSICQNDLNNPTATIDGTKDGIFTSSPAAGLTLNSSTGEINKNTSTIGKYLIKYQTKGLCPDDSTVSIEINPEPVINSISNQIQNKCFGASFDPIVFTGTSVQKFNWTNNQPSIGLEASGEGNINTFIAKGTVFGGNSIVATVKVTPEINGCLGTSQNIQLTVNPIDNPAFSYRDNSFCSSSLLDLNPTPTINGTLGGTFSSSPVGLIMNSATGLIDVITSTPGTYQITYTTPGSCKDDSTVTIGVGSDPAVDDVDDQSYCQGDMFDQVVFTGKPGSVFDWSNSNPKVGLASIGSGNINSFKASGTIDGGGDESATITVTPRIGSCSGTKVNYKYKVRANPKIIGSIVNTSKQDTSFCKGGAAILNATGAARNELYVWTPHTSLVGNLGIGASVTTKTDTTQQYIVRGQSQFGCYNYDTLYVNVYNPTVNQKLDTAVCAETFIKTISFSSKLNGTTFSWINKNNGNIGISGSSGTGNINSFKSTNNTNSVVTAEINVTPKYVIQPINKTCIGPEMTFKINVNKLEDATFKGYLAQYCANETLKTIPTITGSTGGIFTSSPNGLALKSNSGEIFPISSKPGSYSVKYTTSGVCPRSDSTYLFINPLLTGTISGADTVCVNAVSPKIKFKGGNGVAPYIFKYKLNGGAIQTIITALGKDEVTVSVPTSKAGIFTYELVSVKDSSSSQCINTNVFGVQTVLVKELPLAQITTTSPSVCAGGNAPEVRITGVNGVSPFTFTYFISKDGNPFGTPQNVSTSQGQFLAKIPVSTIDPGVYNYTVNVVKNGDDLSCSNNVNISQTVTVKPLPSGKITASPSGVCMNGDANIEFFGLNGTPPFTFVYSINNGGNQTIKSSNTAYNVILKANTNTSGTFNYKIISISDGDITSCQNNNINNAIDLFVTPGTKVNKVQDINVCVNEKSDTIEFVGGVLGTKYDWYSNNTTVGVSGTGTGNILPFISKNNSGSTTNISRITVIPSVGQCKGDTMKFDIVVRPKPKAKINAPNTVCPGDSLKLEGVGNELKYVWTPNVSCITCNPVIAKPTENTTYKAFVTDKYNCFDSTEFDVVVYRKPEIKIDDPVVCGEPELVTLKGKNNNVYTYSEGKIDGVPFMPNKGKTSYIVYVKDNLGCKNSDTVNVYVIDKPVSKFTATPEYGLASDLKPLNVLLTNQSLISNEFEWFFRNGEESPLIKNTPEPVTALYKKPGIYVITLISKNGKCLDSSSISIKIDKLDTPRVEIAPNVFTPDNDGTNDAFYITVKNAKDIHVMIFNRWGNPIYEMTETSQSWDGRVNGKDADEGVYYYHYEIEGSSGEKIKGQGYVQLIRH